MKIFNNLEDTELFEAIIFFDLEYTCWGDNNVNNNWLDVKRPPEIIQMGFAYYDKHESELSSTFSSYVKPKINPILSSYCKTLLNINQKLINNAPTLNDTIECLFEWSNRFSSKIIFSSWGYEDCCLFDDDCKRGSISNPLKNMSYLDLMRVSYDTIGFDDEMYWDREKVKKYLNIHKEDHVHDALQDAIELKDILQELENKYYEQALI